MRRLARQTLCAPTWRARNSEALGLALWAEGVYTLRALVGHAPGAAVRAVSISGEGLASGGDDGRAIAWDACGRCIRSIAHPSAVNSVALETLRLATACADGVVRVFRPSDGALELQVCGHPQGAGGVAWINLVLLLSGGAEGSMRLWNVDSARAWQSLRRIHRRCGPSQCASLAKVVLMP